MNTAFGGLFVRSSSLRMLLFLNIAQSYQTGFKTDRKEPHSCRQVIHLICKAVMKAARTLSPSSEDSLNTAAAHVVDVSETGAPWLRQRSPFDILYKKQTVRAGRVHKHSERKSVETTACQLPCAKRWRRMECSNTFMMTEETEKKAELIHRYVCGLYPPIHGLKYSFNVSV